MSAIPRGLSVTVLRGSAPADLQPALAARHASHQRARRIAIVGSDLPYGSVHAVMSGLLDGLRGHGLDARMAAPDEPAGDDDLVLAWGHHNLRRRLGLGDAAPLALIDPLDGWAVRPSEIGEKAQACVAVFGLSQHSCSALVHLGLPGGQVKPLRLGVDSRVFSPGRGAWPELASDTTWSNIPVRPLAGFCFLHCGFLGQPRKGTGELLRAYCHAFTARDDVTLVIKGSHEGWGADLREELVRAVGHHGAPHVVYLWPRLSQAEVASLYRAADCVVVPSRLEGFGLVALEAMACGTPVLSTGATGHAEYVTDGNALVIPTRDERMDPRIATAVAGRVALADGSSAARVSSLRWASIDVPALTRLLREAHGGGRPASAERIAAGLTTARRFSWSRTAMDLVSGLAEVGMHVRRRSQRLAATPQRTAFVIAAHNCAEDLNRCLATLAGLAPGAPLHVVIVDDGSTDATQQALDAWRPLLPITAVRHQRRGGVVASRIDGTRALGDLPSADFVCYLDADVHTDGDDWLHALIDAHVDGISGPKLLWDREDIGATPMIWSAGAELLGPPDYAGCRGYGLPDGPEYDVPREVDAVPGALMFMRRELLEHVEWDPAYGAYGYEDIDLCLQVTRVRGEHIWYRPHIVLHHRAGSFARSCPGAPEHVSAFAAARDVFVRKWGLAPSP